MTNFFQCDFVKWRTSLGRKKKACWASRIGHRVRIIVCATRLPTVSNEAGRQKKSGTEVTGNVSGVRSVGSRNWKFRKKGGRNQKFSCRFFLMRITMYKNLDFCLACLFSWHPASCLAGAGRSVSGKLFLTILSICLFIFLLKMTKNVSFCGAKRQTNCKTNY